MFSTSETSFTYLPCSESFIATAASFIVSPVATAGFSIIFLAISRGGFNNILMSSSNFFMLKVFSSSFSAAPPSAILATPATSLGTVSCIKVDPRPEPLRPSPVFGIDSWIFLTWFIALVNLAPLYPAWINLAAIAAGGKTVKAKMPASAAIVPGELVSNKRPPLPANKLPMPPSPIAPLPSFLFCISPIAEAMPPLANSSSGLTTL